jgi:UDP-N-acetylglucosamine 2-epimerase (hydrolysing)
LFITGTRADYGKLKSLIKAVENHPDFEAYIYVTGMHMLNRYGYTAGEIFKDGYDKVYTNINQHIGDKMEIVLANTVQGVSHYVHELKPDLIVVHGDRVEALGSTIVGALSNTLVAHIEGGELSGTIDDSIRHSISKLAHVHFVCNEDAHKRLHAMGEVKESIYEIGSPDYDLMFKENLPSLSEVLSYYKIPFDEFGILLFHSVTTDADNFADYARELVDAVNQSGRNFVAIYPNNDEGSNHIFDAFENMNCDRIKLFPSLSFERFVVLLKHCRVIVGNSSAGIREAPCYGIPSINIGDRQNKRFRHVSIIDVDYSRQEILDAIENNWNADFSGNKVNQFGSGDSAEKFISSIEDEAFWSRSIQKTVFDD